MKTNELNPITVTHADSVLDVLGGTFDFSNYYGNIDVACIGGAGACKEGCVPGCKDNPKTGNCFESCKEGCSIDCKPACKGGVKSGTN